MDGGFKLVKLKSLSQDEFSALIRILKDFSRCS